MARTVQIELDVQDAKAVAAWQRSRDSIAQFHKQLDGVDQSNQKNKNSANAFFGEVKRGIRNAAGAVIGFTGVAGGMLAVVQQLRAEYDNIIQRQRNSADATKTFEQSLAGAVRNAVGIFSAEETRDKSLQLAAESGIPTARAAGLFGSSLTSIGPQNKAEANLAFDAAMASAKYARLDDAATQESLAGVAGGIAKKSGITPEAAIGFMARVGQQANIRDLTQQVKNIAPGIPGLLQFGFSEGEAGSLMATISQQTFDEEGAITLTASLALAESLRERFRDDRRYQNADGSFNPIAAITAIQQNPALRKRFLEGGEFGGKKFGEATLGRGRAKPAIEALLTRGTLVSRQFAGGIDAIGSFADGEGTYEELRSAIDRVTPVSATKMGLASGTDRLNVTNIEAISAEVREELPKLLQAAGSSDLRQKMARLGLEVESELGTNPLAALQYAIQTVRSESTELRKGRLVETTSGIGDIYGMSQPEYVRRPVTDREKSTAETFDRVATRLDRLINILEQGPQVNLNVNGNAQVAAEPQPRAAALGAR